METNLCYNAGIGKEELIRLIQAAIITVSDKGSQGLREDQSGPCIQEMLQGIAEVKAACIVPDERDQIAEKLREYSDSMEIDVIFTTGGTGFTPRDVTPEATMDVIDRHAPGIAEAMRMKSLQITDRAMLSRATAGIRKRTAIINMPGSPKAVRECMEVVLPVLGHMVDTLRGTSGDCAQKG